MLLATPACGVDDLDSVAGSDNLEDVSEPRDGGLVPVPSLVWIEGLLTHGVGCAGPSTVFSDISLDRRSFYVIFFEMTLRNPPGAPVKTKNCVASVKLHVPSGWQASVKTVTTNGYVYLEELMTARQTTNYFVAGYPLDYTAELEFEGPIEQFYTHSDTSPAWSSVWSPCGKPAIFGINTTLTLNAVSNPDGVGFFNSTDVAGNFKKRFAIDWREC
ncbi:DUF4360 domain-containing protein [Enhygromyxa salina]|uniref:DUF4360 domain-containing protein n=1 Tax=Enhygromyxa salina TaxID=215803 RepID=UPI0015E72F1F|nr:DUF4360 domain-containing protein [Enhygromyxa salina]